VVLLRVTTVNLTAVDVKDKNKNDVNSASAHSCIYFLYLLLEAKSRFRTCPIEVNRV